MNRFLSWPGAKFRQMPDILEVLPRRDYTTIVEPFFGTGAFTWAFFEHQPKHLLMAEADDRLRDMWWCLLYRTRDFIDLLARVREEYASAGADREVFNKLRDGYNSIQAAGDYMYASAMLWVLVYQSTNNLARFNKSGGYNQTWGKGRKVPDPLVIFGEVEKKALDWAYFASDSFKHFSLDFDRTREQLGEHLLYGEKPENCLVFLDPPYIVRTETYQRGCWTMKEEEELFGWMREMDSQGVPWLMTNYLEKDGVSHPYRQEIEDTWEVRNLDRKLDTRPNGSNTPVSEVMILGKGLS